MRFDELSEDDLGDLAGGNGDDDAEQRRVQEMIDRLKKAATDYRY
jgi:hypothetical protein